MKSSLNGLIGHLKTLLSTNIAHATQVLDPGVMAEYLAQLERSSNNILRAFDQQREKAVGPWNQDEFERLLAEWTVACDQPFEEVDRPEFRKLLEYTHHRPSLHIPHRKSIRTRIMKMGEDTMEGVKKMIAELNSKVSLSLDAWTSLNQHAFLAIVMHYVTNEGQLEELLIDFRELIGEHSGRNMASEVWGILETYGLKGKVLAIVADNAANNDTMVKSLGEKCEGEKIPFSAKDAWM